MREDRPCMRPILGAIREILRIGVRIRLPLLEKA
jgi:hypothetical protein